MKVLHAYCLNYNIGDYALGIGERNLFRKYLDIDFIGTTNIQGRYFDEYYINEVVNKKYNLLVIGGGGIIHGFHWPNGWFWLIKKENIKKIKIPFIIYAAGVNYWEDEKIPDKAINHLKETFEYASFFSVRNDGSYERMKNEVGITPFEIPDPGFFVGMETNYPNLLNKKYVIIQVANDKQDSRFLGEEHIKQFILNMKEITINLSKKYFVLFVPHVFSDIELSKEIANGIDNCLVCDFSKYAFDHCEIPLSYYKYAEFVLSMRGHGQIIPIGFNVPVIALCNHFKHSGIMGKLGISEYSVFVNDINFKDKLMFLVSEIEKKKRYYKKTI